MQILEQALLEQMEMADDAVGAVGAKENANKSTDSKPQKQAAADKKDMNST